MLVLLESVHGGIKGRVIDEDGKQLEGAIVDIIGKEKHVTTSNRGEFWRLLLPGHYSIKAKHADKFGELESDLCEVDVINNLGEGALEIVLIARIKIKETFTVTGMKNGGSKFFDKMYFDEVKGFFHDCIVCDLQISDQACTNVENSPKSRQVTFHVTVIFSPLPMLKFFQDNWGESNIRRPTTDLELEKLKMKVSMYSKEMWCGKREEWLVRMDM